MGQENINALAMLNINKNIEVIPEEVSCIFARKYPQKLQLQFI
jgi:hypothetical protein